MKSDNSDFKRRHPISVLKRRSESLRSITSKTVRRTIKPVGAPRSNTVTFSFTKPVVVIIGDGPIAAGLIPELISRGWTVRIFVFYKLNQNAPLCDQLSSRWFKNIDLSKIDGIFDSTQFEKAMDSCRTLFVPHSFDTNVNGFPDFLKAISTINLVHIVKVSFLGFVDGIDHRKQDIAFVKVFKDLEIPITLICPSFPFEALYNFSNFETKSHKISLPFASDQVVSFVSINDVIMACACVISNCSPHIDYTEEVDKINGFSITHSTAITPVQLVDTINQLLVKTKVTAETGKSCSLEDDSNWSIKFNHLLEYIKNNPTSCLTCSNDSKMPPCLQPLHDSLLLPLIEQVQGSMNP